MTNSAPMNDSSVRACFSADYAEARAKFIALAQQADASLEHHVLEGQLGAQGETLATDVALFGASGDAPLLVLSSGVHGVEGFCGSGCQLALLHDTQLLQKAHERGVAVLLIHAINPYGFSHLRRTNEDNIDLNRNFIDFAHPTRNPAYAEVQALMLPAEWPPTAANAQAIGDYVAAHGDDAFHDALVTGQSEFADGLFYAGTAPSWSNRTLRAILRRHGEGRRRIAWIDVHTGLGPRGHGEKIHNGLPGMTENLHQARAIWGADVVAAWEGDSSSRQVVGHAATAVIAECPQAEGVGITLEYGTDDTAAMHALRAEQWLYRHPHAASAGQRAAIKQQLRDAFYVDHDEWRGMVAGQCRVALLQACLALGR
ncbi:M14 family metallopeptidase [Variovorax sp. J22P271]|uniref:M14 family metallopeptidase n=1 Tax=Variovorax davisae TaxID=3053515 RepID=UPI0025756263|nr:M14 family metallopeptidase [Variovorax sp. J22P271]MDM0033785.1 M14 family metallopeptidase [Variovorax sp. J22P271]